MFFETLSSIHHFAGQKPHQLVHLFRHRSQAGLERSSEEKQPDSSHLLSDDSMLDSHRRQNYNTEEENWK